MPSVPCQPRQQPHPSNGSLRLRCMCESRRILPGLVGGPSMATRWWPSFLAAVAHSAGRLRTCADALLCKPERG